MNKLTFEDWLVIRDLVKYLLRYRYKDLITEDIIYYKALLTKLNRICEEDS